MSVGKRDGEKGKDKRVGVGCDENRDHAIGWTQCG